MGDFDIMKSVKMQDSDRIRMTDRDLIRLNSAAHFFVNHSRDGLILSRLVGAPPLKLSKWSETSHWASALKLWGYTGNPALEGEEFHRQVQRSRVRKSLNWAGYLWRRLWSGKPNSKLREFLGDDNGDILTDGRGDKLAGIASARGTRRDSPPSYEVD